MLTISGDPNERPHPLVNMPITADYASRIMERVGVPAFRARCQIRESFNVVLDFVNSDGKGKEWHDKALWEVNLVTRKVLYRTKFAKAFSWIPDK